MSAWDDIISSMELGRPTLALITSSREPTRIQHPAKAVKHLAEHDLGYRGIEIDVDRLDYQTRQNRNPLIAVRRRAADNSLVAIVTTLENGEIPPRFLNQAAAVRETAQRAIPVFAISVGSGETVQDVGDNIHIAQADSVTLFENLRDLGATVPPSAGQAEENTALTLDILRAQSNRNALRDTLEQFDHGEDYEFVQFGYAVETHVMANDWSRGIGSHFRSVRNLKKLLDIADNARAKRWEHAGKRYVPPPRDIAFGYWWDAVEGYDSPLVQIETHKHTEEALIRVGGHILDEHQAVPLSWDYNVLDQNYTHPNTL
jgi:hypothetical protein